MRDRDSQGLTGELKSAAREALQLGARYAEAGRAWLNQRTTMMNQRPNEPRWGTDDRHDPARQQHSVAAGSGDYGRGQPGGSGRYGHGEHDEYDAAAAHRGTGRSSSPGQYGQQEQNHDGGWQPPGGSYSPDQQGRQYGSMHAPYQAGRAGGGDHSAHGEQEYGGGGGYSGYAGYSQAQQGTHLEDPSLGIGRYGGGRQMDYGAYMHEDYPRRSAGYGRGYGAGSGYTGDDANPQQGRHMQGDRTTQRSYRGRGPRQYTRSDDRILEDICERLTDDDYIDASDITVRVDSGMVTLSGEVPERWMKHRAEDMTDACSGVRQVENRLRVHGNGWSQGSYQSRSASADRLGGSNPSGESGGATTPSGGTQTH